MVNEALVRRYFPTEDPIGQLVTVNVVREERPRQIVGVVGKIRQGGVTRAPRPGIYASFRQQPEAYPGDGAESRVSMTLLIRAASDRAALTAAVRKLAAEIDKNQPLYQVLTMEEILAGRSAFSRFYMSLLAVFAAVALALAAIGIYGVMTYTVNERTHEIGIRMALGAGPAAVLRLVLRQGLKLALVGLALGLIASLAVTRVLANFLYDVKPTDPATFAAVSLLLVAIALLAAYNPARRAARIDPLVALRSE